MQGRILFKISLSNNLAKKGRRLIGRHDEGRSGGIFSLGKRMMIEHFQSSAKCANLRAMLNIIVSRTIALFGRHLPTSAVIKS